MPQVHGQEGSNLESATVAPAEAFRNILTEAMASNARMSLSLHTTAGDRQVPSAALHIGSGTINAERDSRGTPQIES